MTSRRNGVIQASGPYYSLTWEYDKASCRVATIGKAEPAILEAEILVKTPLRLGDCVCRGMWEPPAGTGTYFSG